MGAREKMKQWRETYGIDYSYLSKITGISSGLIGMVEHGDVTHPKIVGRLQEFFKLTDDEAEELLPKNRRPHDPEYEPDKYVAEVDRQPPIVAQKQTLYERYMTEHYNEQVRSHAKRSHYQ
jgi:transcriptional regulator with XRE-family HTH domain